MKRVIAIGLFVITALLAGILLKKEVVDHAAAGGGQGGGAEKCLRKERRRQWGRENRGADRLPVEPLQRWGGNK